MEPTEGGKQMKKVVPIVVALMLMANVALAVTPMYCGEDETRVVMTGDTMERVLFLCGTPYERTVYIGIEIWRYINPASDLYDFYLTFEQGRLSSIDRH